MANNFPTNNDALLDELKHDVERDRWLSLWKRYQVLVIAAIAAIVLATAANSYWQHHRTQQNMAMTDALYKAMGTSKTSPDEAAKGLLAFAEEHEGTDAGFMAQIQAAGLLLRADKKADAMLQLEAALANTSADEDLRAITTFKYIQIGFDRLEATQVADMLAPYQNDDSAFRFIAWELGALNAYRAGDKAKAGEFLAKILADKDVTTGVKVRAADMQRVLVK